MFPADLVLEVANLLPDAVIDGGWGVDALAGRQSRVHSDLDLVAAAASEPIDRLGVLGFTVELEDLPMRVVLVDDHEHHVDVHLVDEHNVQVVPNGGAFTYPPTSALGSIDGAAVRCLLPDVQVLAHGQYEPDADDRHDMAIVASTGVALPPPYAPTLSDALVRDAVDADFAALVVVRLRSWRAAYRGGIIPDAVIDSIDIGAAWRHRRDAWHRGETVVVVLGPPGEVHGYALATIDDVAGSGARAPREAEVHQLYLDPTVMGGGHGAAVLDAAVERLRGLGHDDVTLWTVDGNARARRFYEREGWHLDGGDRVEHHERGSWRSVRYRLHVGS
ncbi:MAG: hypothetical protein QOE63_1660 [Acidimicrobiaceae bacterium]